MRKKVIILNGPPRCGKDTLGGALLEHLLAVFPGTASDFKFTDALTDMALSISGISKDEWHARYETQKSEDWGLLGGLSQRAFLIRVAEDWVKPVFGKAFFADQAVKSVSQSDFITAVFTDGGFPAEVEAFLKAGTEVHIVRVHREGCDFSQDSRRYLNAYQFKDNPTQPEFHDINNDAGIPELKLAAFKLLHTIYPPKTTPTIT